MGNEEDGGEQDHGGFSVLTSLLLLGLGHPALHQGMTPGFPAAMGGALPSAYQFARDPQSGQLVVIPSEHLPHFGEYASKEVGRSGSKNPFQKCE